jgi:hypothetical protein
MAIGAGADKVGPTVADVAAPVTPPVTPVERLDLLSEHIYEPGFVQGDGAARTLRKIHAPSKVLRQLAQPTHAEAM